MAEFSETAIRLATALIPMKDLRKQVRKRLLKAARSRRVAKALPRLRARYADHVQKCHEKLARGERLKVAFLVCDASMFSGEGVYTRLAADPRFDCEILVAPRVTRGEDFLRRTLAKTVETLSARYGAAVRSLYDPDARKGAAVDADLVFSTVVYEDQTLPDYTTERLSARALVCVLYYGYGGLFISNERKTPYLPNIVFAWRYFVSNDATRALSVERNPALAENVVVSGYCKMDRLEREKARVAERRRAASSERRKKVVICPHHTLDRVPGELALSTFPAHADLFMRLPDMFPEIDFVFRPHPLLFPRLATAKWWGPERTESYVRAMEAHPNVDFQRGGDYFATFADSDAMIHDCGSFLAEYFYTDKPQCYLLEGPRTVEEQFLPFSRRLLDYAYRATTDGEIVGFIQKVVLAGDDPDREARDAFAAREVCVNHPDASGAVIREVLSALGIAGTVPV